MKPTLEDQLRAVWNSDKSSPRISAIRFPHFKALEHGLRIEFTFPVTALVGQNGSNKSPILHALYCAPDGYSMANLWFSTKLDPIETDKNNHRLIYEYPIRTKSGTRVAEVRKSRVTKKFRNDWVPKPLDGQNDPDYWEPTKRVAVDDMAPIPEGSEFDAFLSGRRDRWRPIKKNVVYLDFREELSAYDKFVHHTARDRWTKNPTERRYRVITRSPELAIALSSMKRTSDRTDQPRLLSKEQVGEVSRILGKNFSEIKLIRHRCYGVEGYSAQMTLDGHRYSEAHAGSGEFAVIRLVDEISSAPDASLILLDEPEVSLHPGAQAALIEYIKGTCIKNGHQVVLSTHSPTIVESLPADAVKLLGTDGTSSTVRLLSQMTSPHHAFFNLGYVTSSPGRRVLVEDPFVEEIVRTACRVFDPSSLVSVKVLPFPGGADRIVHSVIPTLTTSDISSTSILLDGDQLPESDDSAEYPMLSRTPNWEELDQIPGNAQTIQESEERLLRWRAFVKSIFGDSGRFDIHSRDSDEFRSNVREMEEIQQNLRWCRKNVRFLAGRVPEAALLHEVDPTHDASMTTKAAKGIIEEMTRVQLNKADHEMVKGAEILETQKRMLADLARSAGRKSPLLSSAYDAVQCILLA